MIARLRSRAVALIAAIFFLPLGASEVLGSVQCLYHGAAQEAEGAERSGTPLRAAGHGNRGVGAHDAHGSSAEHGHRHDPAHGHAPVDDAAASSDHASGKSCECELRCVVTGAGYSLQTGAVLAMPGDAVTTPAAGIPSSDDDVEPRWRFPYLLPFAQAPPSHLI